MHHDREHIDGITVWNRPTKISGFSFCVIIPNPSQRCSLHQMESNDKQDYDKQCSHLLHQLYRRPVLMVMKHHPTLLLTSEVMKRDLKKTHTLDQLCFPDFMLLNLKMTSVILQVSWDRFLTMKLFLFRYHQTWPPLGELFLEKPKGSLHFFIFSAKPQEPRFEIVPRKLKRLRMKMKLKKSKANREFSAMFHDDRMEKMSFKCDQIFCRSNCIFRGFFQILSSKCKSALRIADGMICQLTSVWSQKRWHSITKENKHKQFRYWALSIFCVSTNKRQITRIFSLEQIYWLVRMNREFSHKLKGIKLLVYGFLRIFMTITQF